MKKIYLTINYLFMFKPIHSIRTTKEFKAWLLFFTQWNHMIAYGIRRSDK